MKRKLFIIFLTGLTNSGKTTISNLLFKYFKNIGLKSKNIDGDKFRKKIKNFKFNKAGRIFVGDRKIKLAQKFRKQGFNVIVSGVAPNRDWRKKNKKIKDFFEIYLNCSFKETLKRNTRVNKKKFLNSDKNNIIGLDQPYEKGVSKDLIINTDKLNKKQSLIKIVKFLRKKNFIN